MSHKNLLKLLCVCTAVMISMMLFWGTASQAADTTNMESQVASIAQVLENLKNLINEKTKSSFAAVITYSGKQLISQATHISDSKDFAAERPVERLWDGCTVSTPNCVAASPSTSSFFVDFDFGSLYTLEAARLFADADGTSFSQTWSLEYKKESGDVWTPAFKDSDAYANGWVEKPFTNIVARYIRVTVGANRAQAAAPEAREIEVYGVPAEVAPTLPLPTLPPSTTTPSSTFPEQTPGLGNTYIVSPYGDDSNPGTLDLPFKTPQKAVDLARAGDTILVRTGTYTDGVIFGYSGTKEKPIIFRNFPDERPLFNFGVTNASSPARRIELQSREKPTKPISWIIIEGLELTNALEAIKFTNAENVTIRNNNIHDTFLSGIVGSGGYHVSITGNKIYRIGLKDFANTSNDMLHHGLLITGSNYTITNNIIYDVRAYGIYAAAHLFSITQYADENFSGGKNILIANNVIAHTRFKSGIGLWQDGVVQAKILNNIFYENAQNLSTGDTAGVEFISTGAAHIVQNNIFLNPGKLDFPANANGLYTGSNNIHGNPLFVHAEQNDFHLQTNSSAIDTGVTVPENSTDIAGSLRPSGCCFDIGAYEFSPTPIVSIPPLPQPTTPIPSTPLISPTAAANTAIYSPNSSLRVVGAYTIRVRKDPALTGSIVGRKNSGATATMIEGPILANGYAWYKVKFTSDNLIGWAAGEFLRKADMPEKMFALGTTVTTTATLSVRETPGGTRVGEQTRASTGTILEATPVYKPYQGVLWWWKIDYTLGSDGWSAADYLQQNLSTI